MNKKEIVLVISIAIVTSVITNLLISEFNQITSNPRIYLNSGGTFQERSFNSFPPANISYPSSGILVVSATNNWTISIFNLAIEVSYRMVGDKWNTTKITNLGFLNVGAGHTLYNNLTNPFLVESLWEFLDIRTGTYYLVNKYDQNASDRSVIAYGFAKP